MSLGNEQRILGVKWYDYPNYKVGIVLYTAANGNMAAAIGVGDTGFLSDTGEAEVIMELGSPFPTAIAVQLIEKDGTPSDLFPYSAGQVMLAYGKSDEIRLANKYYSVISEEERDNVLQNYLIRDRGMSMLDVIDFKSQLAIAVKTTDSESMQQLAEEFYEWLYNAVFVVHYLVGEAAVQEFDDLDFTRVSQDIHWHEEQTATIAEWAEYVKSNSYQMSVAITRDVLRRKAYDTPYAGAAFIDGLKEVYTGDKFTTMTAKQYGLLLKKFDIDNG